MFNELFEQIPSACFPCGWRWQRWSADPWRWGWWRGEREQSLPHKPTRDSFRTASQTNPGQDEWAAGIKVNRNITLEKRKKGARVIWSACTLTLNSVGTMSLGVLRPTSISKPTNVMMDIKMEKSLINFLSWIEKSMKINKNEIRNCSKRTIYAKFSFTLSIY